MAEGTAADREPRYWKITINPEECASGAWGVCLATGLAMLGLPGDTGETHYAVKNLKRVREGDWLVAYTPQEGSYCVGGVGVVTDAYRCEEGPFDHPWNGPVRRSVGVAWVQGACRIADLVADGRFRKGKISRLLDEILPAEFEVIRERVCSAPAAGAEAVETLPESAEMIVPAPADLAPPTVRTMWTLPDTEESLLPLMAERMARLPQAAAPIEEPEWVTEEPTLGTEELEPVALFLPEELESLPRSMTLEEEWESAVRDLASDEEWAVDPPVAVTLAEEEAEQPETAAPAAPEAQELATTFELVADEAEPGEAEPGEVELEVAEPRLVPSPVVFDPLAEPPPLPEFFLERAMTEPAPIFQMEEPVRYEPRSTPRPIVDEWELEAPAEPRRAASPAQPPRTLAEAAASLRQSHAAHLLAGLGIPESSPSVLDFGMPTVGEDELLLDEHVSEQFAFLDEGTEPFEVRVGALGWTGVFRREVESGRPCSLLLRGPQYSFLNMAEPGEPLRGLPLFALFAIGAVSAPGKEALRGGATFIFQGRRASGDWAVEVRPRRRRPVAQTAARTRS
jgi:hypothetical protein